MSMFPVNQILGSGYPFFRAKKEDIDSVNEKTAAKYGSVAAPIIVEKTTSSTMVAELVWSRHVSQFWRKNNVSSSNRCWMKKEK
ncbi:hypothetical protein ISN45_Aa06g027360 [Arabidopsis thaliana x Arabidopsis arenosa]|uniref:Uncharacterized protein n=2 Tax=Arabidopsis TaxID=3701 RepID=A0A8T1Z2L3_9BRAS|nr:hypothetical protein ISN45_Aa06g027360 [Arabidopsis thaliana x Arabidopsis arenosa]KAG7552130.1 hypothetical protein ISN45_Aa06g027360 [Arabidopsis thaliana x Arabidopsis arenosa]KAG7557316.1 hypothetical protein ISN44_As11g032920 [Arabidopsis suecica]